MRSKSRFNSAPGVATVVAAAGWTLLDVDTECDGSTGGAGVRRAAAWPPAHCGSGRCTQGIERQVCKHQIFLSSNKSSRKFIVDHYHYHSDLGFYHIAKVSEGNR